MSSSGQPRITGYGVGAPKITLNPPPVISTRDPATTDYRFPLGQQWVNKDANNVFQLTSVVAGVASWVLLGGSTGAISAVNGTANQITASTVANVVTLSLPAAIVAPGSLTTTTSLSATTTVTAGTGMTCTTGNIVCTAGDITATAGNISAGAAVSATTTVTAGTGITATTGDIVATAGQVNAGTSMTAGTTITATLGAITATNGDLVLGTAGNKIQITTGANASAGTATLSSGTVTVMTTAVTANSLIFLSRKSIGSTGANPIGLLSVGTITAGASFVINALTEADATSVVATDVSDIDWLIIN